MTLGPCANAPGWGQARPVPASALAPIRESLTSHTGPRKQHPFGMLAARLLSARADCSRRSCARRLSDRDLSVERVDAALRAANGVAVRPTDRSS